MGVLLFSLVREGFYLHNGMIRCSGCHYQKKQKTAGISDECQSQWATQQDQEEILINSQPGQKSGSGGS